MRSSIFGSSLFIVDVLFIGRYKFDLSLLIEHVNILKIEEA